VTILVADDMHMVRHPIATYLGRRGHRVIEAEDGDGALAILASEKIDALIIDVAMPMKDGLATLEAAAARGPLPPTLVVTGQTDEKTVARAMALGARGVVRKATMQLKQIAEMVEGIAKG
jgi:DNA-binding NarL/FixJ family response regulator